MSREMRRITGLSIAGEAPAATSDAQDERLSPEVARLEHQFQSLMDRVEHLTFALYEDDERPRTDPAQMQAMTEMLKRSETQTATLIALAEESSKRLSQLEALYDGAQARLDRLLFEAESQRARLEKSTSDLGQRLTHLEFQADRQDELLRALAGTARLQGTAGAGLSAAQDAPGPIMTGSFRDISDITRSLTELSQVQSAQNAALRHLMKAFPLEPEALRARMEDPGQSDAKAETSALKTIFAGPLQEARTAPLFRNGASQNEAQSNAV